MIGKDNLVAGDHIYRYGKGWTYSHHGIYMGEKDVKESTSSSSKSYKTVIHYTRTEGGGTLEPCYVCNYRNNLQRGIVETCIECFLLAGHKHIYLYEYGVSQSKAVFSRGGTCSTQLSGPSSDVADLTFRLCITNLFGRYHLLRNNCEHFAHFCRTGSSRSQQVESLITLSLIFMVLLMSTVMKGFFTVLIIWTNVQGYISIEHTTIKMINVFVWLISLFLFMYLFLLLGEIRESHRHSFFILEKLKQKQKDYQPPQWLVNACKMPGLEEVDELEQGDYQPPQMPGLEEVDVQAMCYGSIFSFTPEKRKDDVKKDDGKKSWEYKLQPRLIFASRMPGPEEVDMLTFDYIGFWRKAWKAFVSEHLKPSLLENIEDQVRQTGEENKLGNYISGSMSLLKLLNDRGRIKTYRDTLESGDHIYRFGQEKIHTHHGIYIGEDMVIHYTRTEEEEKESSSSKTCPECKYRSDLHRGVVKTCLDCFLAGQDQIYWYAYGISRSVASSFPVGSYSTRQSRPSSEVVDCASQILESGVKDYNLFFNNCEDFAHFCKTRDPKSSQTEKVRNSLWSFTQNIIKLATEMGYFGLGGPANMKAIFLVLLPFLLIVVSLIVSIGVPMLLGA